MQLPQVQVPEALLRVLRQQSLLRSSLRLRVLQQLAEVRLGQNHCQTAHPDEKPRRLQTVQVCQQERGAARVSCIRCAVLLQQRGRQHCPRRSVSGSEEASLQGMQLPKVPLPEEVLRVLPARRSLLRPLQLRPVPQHRAGSERTQTIH